MKRRPALRKGNRSPRSRRRQARAWADTITVTPEGGYLMGNPDAPLKLLEYASLTCPHCADFSRMRRRKLRDKYAASGVVSYELRNQIHDGLDLTMAMLTRCGAPESFHALSEQVWLNLPQIIQTAQGNQAALSAAMTSEDQSRNHKAIADAAGLTDFFAARGISSDQSATCTADAAKAEQIVQNSQKQSEELRVDPEPPPSSSTGRSSRCEAGRTWNRSCKTPARDRERRSGSAARQRCGSASSSSAASRASSNPQSCA